MRNLENENGRSMIEMLGVLAIIGVLSVGGIAGYSKAMTKYRINKTIEQVVQISQNIRTFFAPQKDFYGLPYTAPNSKELIQKAKLIPDEMLELNTNGTIKQINNAFGGTVEIGIVYSLDFSQGASTITNYKDNYYLYFTGISPEACIELLTQDWLNMANLYAISVNIYAGGQNSPSNCADFSKGCSGKKGVMGPAGGIACVNGSTASLPIDLNMAANTFCAPRSNNNIAFYFYK